MSHNFFSYTDNCNSDLANLSLLSSNSHDSSGTEGEDSQSQRKKHGRPTGITNESKRICSEQIENAKKNIVMNYVRIIENNNIGDITKKGLFDCLVKEQIMENSLPDSFSFPYHTAISRIRRGNLTACGNNSPLQNVEKHFIHILLCMAKINKSLRPFESLQLINDCIEGTPVQQELIKWKLRRNIYFESTTDLGHVGQSNWRPFLKKNAHILRCKNGRKYSVDRSNFSTYINIFDMYEHIEKVLLESGLATQFPQPIWMDKDGNLVVDELDAFGMKCTIDITRPDIIFVCDEVGCNLSQEGDNAIGGSKFVTGKDDQAYNQASIRDSHFTCLGITNLEGETVLCVILFTGKKRNIMVETGIDWVDNDNIDGDETHDEEFDFFERNFGDGKLFPGGYTCTFKGKQIPAFVKFTESGGMDGHTLTEIFQYLDSFDLFGVDREKGIYPFMLLDGHQSRFHLNFLSYVNNLPTKWSVCIGVPYGTAYWQVGDSSEQNGTFKMRLAEEKNKLFQHRIKTCQQDLQLLRTDIVPLVNKCFGDAFCNKINNQNAIADRGWYPYNRNLLLNNTIRGTMTQKMLADEQIYGLYPSIRKPIFEQVSN